MAGTLKCFDVESQKRPLSRTPSGRTRRGRGILAVNGSIPTSFQTVITDNAERKGFLSKAKRFNVDNPFAEFPAPCQYVNHDKFDTFSPSFSKKGTGGFPSKDKRGTKYKMSNAPGPGIYSLPSLLASRNDFNKKEVTHIFSHPVANCASKTDRIPAPNAYNVVQCRTGRVNNVKAEAVFKSKSSRELVYIAEQAGMPAPGQYDINDEMLYQNVKVPFSSFRSRSKRNLMAKSDGNPGPGHYRPNEEVEPAKRTLFPRKHCLCISAPAMPLPKTPPMPGPGTYDVADYDDPPKHFMAGSVFLSTTHRWSGKVSDAVSSLPGPGYYQPVTMGKQSFLYNSAGRWL